MERAGWQQTWVRILTTALTVAVMVMIFCFSMENAEDSDQTSGKISMEVIHIIHPDFDEKPPQVQKTIYDDVQYAVRKTAHFTEYALLGLMMRFCLESWVGRRKWTLPAAWAAGTLYAVTDELHQMQIDGRYGQWKDVLIDSSGVLAGILIACMILHLIFKKRQKA